MHLLASSGRVMPRRRGIALSNLLIAVSIVIVACAIGLQSFTGVKEDTDHFNCRQAVNILNASLSTYLQNGGSVPVGATPELMLQKMKKTVAETKSGTFVGLKGPFIDVRLKGEPVNAKSGAPRIVWDSAARRFAIASRGTGWARLIFDDQAAAANHGTEARKFTSSFAAESCWVWDYADDPSARRGPSHIPVSRPDVLPPPPVSTAARLLPPLINPLSGIFDHRSFPLSMTIVNPNTAGISDVLYQINGGAWYAWQGTAVPVEKRLTNTVTAFAQARENSGWYDSDPVTETYITYFLRGSSEGEFTGQAGDKQFVYSLEDNSTRLNWGKAESAGQSASSLEVVPGVQFEAGPSEVFEIGRLRYANGITRAGTNAQSASIRIDLILSVPSTQTLSVTLPVRMLNTIHFPNSHTAHTDFLWVPRRTELPQILTILDRQFRITIEAQSDSMVSDNADIKVPIEENRSSEVLLTARLTSLN